MDIFDFLARNWTAISANPLPFVLGLVVGASVASVFIKSIMNGRAATLEERINLIKEDKERLREENERLKGKELELKDALRSYEVNLSALIEKVEVMEQRVEGSAVEQADLAELRERVEAMPRTHVGPDEPENAKDGDFWDKY